MKQVATVERVLSDGRAEIAVKRQSACGHDCENCAGCGVGGGVVRATAYDAIGVAVGDKVVVYSDDTSVLGTAAVVYLLPVMSFFVGYALAASFSSMLVRVLTTLAATALGVLPAILLDRRGRRVRFEIREKL